MRIHVANHFLQLIRGEHVAEDVEHFAGAFGIEVGLDGLNALEQFVQHAAFARVRGDEIEDEAILLLAVTVDAAHALLQPDGIPWDIVVDHQPAELQVDPFAGGFGRHEDLGGFAELALGENAGAGRVAVANLHATVNLRHAEAPFAQFAERASVLAVRAEKIQSVFMFGEDEQFHLRVGEDAVFLDEVTQPDELGFDFALFQIHRLVNELPELSDFIAQRRRIVGRDEVFQFGNDFLLLFFGQVLVVVGEAFIDLRLPVAFGVGENMFALILHALEAATHGVDARSEAALKHRHGEPQRPAPGGIFRRGPDRLILNEAGQGIVKIQLVETDLKLGRADVALREQRLDLASFGVGERNQRLFDAAKVKRRFLLPHRFFQAFHVAINVAVEQFQE